MSRKTDLERSIRESHSLIGEYEDIIRLSDRSEEKTGKDYPAKAAIRRHKHAEEVLGTDDTRES